MRKKTFFAVLITILIMCISVNSASALNIYNVRVEEITENSAVVKWETDENADSTVYYGVSRPPSQRIDENILTKNHEIELTNLFRARQYFFNVQSRTNIATAFDDNGTYSYSFRTQKEVGEEINLTTSVPTGGSVSELTSGINTNQITISGNAKQGSTVRFFVNSVRIPSQIIETGKYSIEVNGSEYFEGTVLLYQTVYQGTVGLNNITINSLNLFRAREIIQTLISEVL
jgi:hypothetical protein